MTDSGKKIEIPVTKYFAWRRDRRIEIRRENEIAMLEQVSFTYEGEK